MTPPNTLNICLGHLPPPQELDPHIDLMVAPKLISVGRPLAIVEDSRFGPEGHTLSEYGQLIWILEHLEHIAPDMDYIRICHYRRFVARQPHSVGEKSSNIAWATTIRPSDLASFSTEFERYSSSELFNTLVDFREGVAGQYATSHVFEDFLLFAQFLLEEGIFTAAETARFVQARRMIPSCNIGVFRKETYIWIFGILTRAARFLSSRHFVLRSEYQRRSTGFLLERLHSYLILRRIEAGASPAKFGHNVVLSDSAVVSATR